MSTAVFSILIGRVSTEDHDRVIECLEALAVQVSPPPYEVVIVDRRQDEISVQIAERFPDVRLIACPATMALPEMRALAFANCSGDYIIVTEDHCVPSNLWLAKFAEAVAQAPKSAAAFGGTVENGVADTALDWATFLCEYSGSIGPRPNGTSRDVPGMNVAYKRAALEAIDPALLKKGFWETTVHPQMEKNGQTLYSSNDILLYHCKKFSLGLFCRQRYVYSRYYAGIRYAPEDKGKRAMSAVLTLVLPPLLLWRMSRNVFSKRRLVKEFIIASPYLALFSVIWAAGEIAGYIGGPGNALLEIE